MIRLLCGDLLSEIYGISYLELCEKLQLSEDKLLQIISLLFLFFLSVWL